MTSTATDYRAMPTPSGYMEGQDELPNAGSPKGLSRSVSEVSTIYDGRTVCCLFSWCLECNCLRNKCCKYLSTIILVVGLAGTLYGMYDCYEKKVETLNFNYTCTRLQLTGFLLLLVGGCFSFCLRGQTVEQTWCCKTSSEKIRSSVEGL